MASFSPSAWARPRGHLTIIFLGISSSGLGSSLGQENNWQKETPVIGFTAQPWQEATVTETLGLHTEHEA